MRIKNLLIVILIFLSTIAYSNVSSNIASESYLNQISNDSKYSSDTSMYPAYSAPARIDVQAAFNFIVSASFIYWQPEMVGIDLGFISSKDLSSSASSVVNFDTRYRAGFKVLLGTHYDYDNWNINARYTRYHANESEKNSKGDITFHVFSDSITISPLRARWKPQIDYFDLEIGRPYYNGKHLVIKPYASIKGGWSKQKLKFSAALNNSDNEANFETKSWFLGPRGVLDVNWLLTYDFKLFLNSSASVMYQKLKTKDRLITNLYQLTYTRRFDAKSIQLTPTFDITPGIGWSSYFDHNNWHLDAFAAYNFIYFFNQNEFTSVDAKGDLMFHGLEISLKLDF